ncbi:DnaD domain protein [Planococcus halotolerans]|uniref:DnaB/C C-terminal domain-containing protein n=1 Tax=Planococcus halotolerans TaxID=2233542 RepID=A0A365KKD7_9BACL|nr:DnaD domain protein [Planococcus halotolerans]RAZ73609.1 hypothetical protein DP120_16870 [Planococcus halotolerans]
MQGWFKLHREMFDSDIWHDANTFRLFVFLIAKASHQDGVKIKGRVLKRGQYIRSYRKLADDLSYKEGRGFKTLSLSTIKKCVSKLVDDERVNVEETELGTLFTIVNYSLYQDSEDIKKESANGEKEEVRTNYELSANELRTNSEQEQELKNLRTKELNSTTATTTTQPADDFGNMLQTFEENICRLSPLQIESFGKWFDDFNQQPEIIIEAISIAANRNKRNFGFVEYLFKEWADSKLKTIEQIQSHERNKFNKQATQKSAGRYQPRSNYGNKPMREELLPEWFGKPEEERVPETVPQSNSQFEEEKQKILAELAAKKGRGYEGD